MIATLVLFRPPTAPDRAEQARWFRARVPIYEGIPGLHFKACLLDPPRGRFGGFHVWESREALDGFLASDLWQSLPQKIGAQPEVTIYEAPAVMARATR